MLVVVLLHKAIGCSYVISHVSRSSGLLYTAVERFLRRPRGVETPGENFLLGVVLVQESPALGLLVWHSGAGVMIPPGALKISTLGDEDACWLDSILAPAGASLVSPSEFL